MALYNPWAGLFRERILAMGGAGMGKSFNYYAIARLAKNTGSDARFFIVDTDVSVGRMLTDSGLAPFLITPDLVADDNGGVSGSIEWAHVSDWKSINAAVDKFQKRMRPHDWLMVDMLTPTWQWCQQFFTDQVFHKDFEEFLLEHRKTIEASKKSDGMFDGWKDWTVINGLYEDFAMKVLRSPGNVYATSEVKAFNSQNASKEDKILFGPHGVIPVGQKRAPHLFSTILWNNSEKPDEWRLTSIKDRSRMRLNKTPCGDFAVDYLVNTGGWKLAAPVAEPVAA